MDFEALPRDDEVSNEMKRPPLKEGEESIMFTKLQTLLDHLECLSTLVKTKNAFQTLKQGGSGGGSSNNDAIDFSYSVVKGCTEDFDRRLLRMRFMDWYMVVLNQQNLYHKNRDLPDQLEKAEMKVSIAGAPNKSLKMVKERLESMASDRQQRLDVLQEMVEELCLREMNIHVKLDGPSPQKVLVLRKTSALGFLGTPLQLAGEPLPVG